MQIFRLTILYFSSRTFFDFSSDFFTLSFFTLFCRLLKMHWSSEFSDIISIKTLLIIWKTVNYFVLSFEIASLILEIAIFACYGDWSILLFDKKKLYRKICCFELGSYKPIEQSRSGNPTAPDAPGTPSWLATSLTLPHFIQHSKQPLSAPIGHRDNIDSSCSSSIPAGCD